MAGIAAHGSVLHPRELPGGDDILAPRRRHENIAQRGRLQHGHHPESVHHGLEGLDRIHFRHDHPGAEALGPHRDTLAAQAIASDHDILPGDDQVRRPVNAVPYALAGSVTVVEQVLAVGVVHEHHREAQGAGAVHRLEAQDAGRRLFAPADHIRQQVSELLVHQCHEVAAIIDDDVRAHLQYAAQVRLVLLHGRPVDGEHVQSFVYQRGGHVILRAERVAAGGIHLGAAGGKAKAQPCRLRLHVHAQGDLQAGKRLGLHEILLYPRKQGHMVADPADLQRSALPQVDVFDVTGHIRLSC